MNCKLCNQKIFHKRELKIGLCSLCISNIQPVIYNTEIRPNCQLSILFSFDKTIKELLYLYKFNNNITVSNTLSALILEHINLKFEPDLIVPVPSHFIDEAKRGYPHMVCLAHKISVEINKPYKNIIAKKLFPLFKRNQKTKTKNQRLKNVQKYYLKNFANIKGKKILLIDDVYTTGTTIKECSKLLLDAGAEKVLSCCIALTPF